VNRVILILNPTTKDHWIYQRWFEGYLGYVEIDGEKIPISNHPDVLHIHTTYLDNLEHLPVDFVAQLRGIKDKNIAKYRHTILGGWLEKAEGVVFENWEEGDFDNSLPYCNGLDFGFYPDPLAMTKVAVDRRARKIYLKERLYEYKLATEQVVSKVSGAVSNRSDLIVTDTNEPRTTLGLSNSGLNVIKAEKGNGSVTQDLKDMMDYQLIIDPESYNLKRELNAYVWNDKKASIPVDANNHLIDAARYGFRRLVGTKPMLEVLSQR
jgi:phage terminase large subunit